MNKLTRNHLAYTGLMTGIAALVATFSVPHLSKHYPGANEKPPIEKRIEQPEFEKEKDALFDLLVHSAGSKYNQNTENGSNRLMYGLERKVFATNYQELRIDISEAIMPMGIAKNQNPNEGLMLRMGQSIASRMKKARNLYGDIASEMYSSAKVKFDEGITGDNLSSDGFQPALESARKFAASYRGNLSAGFADRHESDLTDSLYAIVIEYASNILIFDDNFTAVIDRNVRAIRKAVGKDELGIKSNEESLSTQIYIRARRLMDSLLISQDSQTQEMDFDYRREFIMESIRAGENIAMRNGFSKLIEMYAVLRNDVPKKESPKRAVPKPLYGTAA